MRICTIRGSLEEERGEEGRGEGRRAEDEITRTEPRRSFVICCIINCEYNQTIESNPSIYSSLLSRATCETQLKSMLISRTDSIN